MYNPQVVIQLIITGEGMCPIFTGCTGIISNAKVSEHACIHEAHLKWGMIAQLPQGELCQNAQIVAARLGKHDTG